MDLHFLPLSSRCECYIHREQYRTHQHHADALSRRLGHGATGEVYLALNLDNGDVVAVKVAKQTPEAAESLHDEVSMYESLTESKDDRSRYIPFPLSWMFRSRPSSFLLHMLDYGEDCGRSYLVLPILGISLREAAAYEVYRTFELRECRDIVAQIGEGIQCELSHQHLYLFSIEHSPS